MTDLSHLVTMLSSVIMMDHSKSAYEKAMYSLVITLVAYLAYNYKSIAERAARLYQTRRRPHGCVVRSCQLILEEQAGFVVNVTTPFFETMHDIERRVNDKRGVWGLLSVEQLCVRSQFCKVHLPETPSFVIVGDDFPTVAVSCTSDTHHGQKVGNGGNGETTYVRFVLKLRSTSNNDIAAYETHCSEAYKRLTSGALHTPHMFLCGRQGHDPFLWRTFPFASTKTFDNMFFDAKDALKDVLDNFARSKDDYARLGMPYTLSLLLHGEPGTGKTSVIKSIANYTQRHLIVVPTKHVRTIEDLEALFLRRCIECYTVPMNKRLYVFEEIDCGAWEDMVMDRRIKEEAAREKKRQADAELKVMKAMMMGRGAAADSDEEYEHLAQGPCTRRTSGKKERGANKESDGGGDNKTETETETAKNTTEGAAEKKAAAGTTIPASGPSAYSRCRIALGEFLELLDGIVEMEGRMIIFTTNRVNHLDRAILRPGRVDHVLEIKRLTREDVRCMYRHWFARDLPYGVLIAQLPDRTFTQAELGKLFLTRDMDHIHAALCGKTSQPPLLP